MALILEQKMDDEIVITATNGERIVIKTIETKQRTVRLAFDAPKAVIIDRMPVHKAKLRDAALLAAVPVV